MNSHHAYFFFLVSSLATGFVILAILRNFYIAFTPLSSFQWVVLVCFLLLFIRVGFTVLYLFAKQIVHISKNITENEYRHWRMYAYLQAQVIFSFIL